jgi:hypothetical protein
MSWAEDMGYDAYFGEDLFSEKYWTTKEGKVLKPEQMTIQHRSATITIVAKMRFNSDERIAIASVPILQKMHNLNIKGEK